MPYIICYDITSNKTRKIIHDTLLSYGDKINLSVFELDLNHNKLEKLISYIKNLINPKTETIKIYPLQNKNIAISIGKELKPQNYI